jgi:hypothetical protein
MANDPVTFATQQDSGIIWQVPPPRIPSFADVMSGANSLVGTLVTSVGSKGGSLCNLGTYGYN